MSEGIPNGMRVNRLLLQTTRLPVQEQGFILSHAVVPVVCPHESRHKITQHSTNQALEELDAMLFQTGKFFVHHSLLRSFLS
jgi:hypothetical protein